MSAGDLWLSSGKLSIGPRFAAWFAVHPLLVAAAYFLANIAVPVPAGVFWRSTVAAFLMVLCRYLGDAHVFNPTLGVLLSIAFWLYILGECISEHGRGPAQGAASDADRLLLDTTHHDHRLGRRPYPAFRRCRDRRGPRAGYRSLYTIADLVNLIALALIYLAVAGKERY